MTSKMNWQPQVHFVSTQQEELLKDLKENKGLKSWKKIASILNKFQKDFTKSAKQYRDRYVNYIRFGQSTLKMSQWDEDEELLFLQKYFAFGPKWVQISQQMQGRSENTLKNKFYGLVRKASRRIQKLQKKTKPKPKKFINEKYIIRALDQFRKLYVELKNDQTVPILKDNQECSIKQQLMKLIVFMREDCDQMCIQELISILRKLNSTSGKIISDRNEKQIKMQTVEREESSFTKDRLETKHSQDSSLADEQRSSSQIQYLQDQNVEEPVDEMEMIDFLPNSSCKKKHSNDLMQQLCQMLQLQAASSYFSLLN